MKSKRMRRILVIAVTFSAVLFVILTVVIYASAGPSFECHFPMQGPLQPGISSRVVMSGGIERCYLIYVPSGYHAEQPAAIVFALHGFASNAATFRAAAGWEPIADHEHFLVIYPEGSAFPLRWNIGPIANIPMIDDVQFIRDVITQVNTIAAVDPLRIFVSGFSNGGQMTHRIACALADQVAAVGIVDGLDSGMLLPCAPARPVSVMAFFGTASPLNGITYPKWFQALMNVSINENELTLPANAPSLLIESWARQDGCDSQAETLPAVGNTTGIRYGGCSGGAENVLYTIDGQGHAWPGGPSSPFLGDSIADVNASELLWVFFQQHPLQSAQ